MTEKTRQPDPFVGLDYDDCVRLANSKPKDLNEDETRVYKKVRAIWWLAKKNNKDPEDALREAIDRARNPQKGSQTVSIKKAASPEQQVRIHKRLVEAACRHFNPRKTAVVKSWMKIPGSDKIMSVIPDRRKVHVKVDGCQNIGTMTKGADNFTVSWDDSPDFTWTVSPAEAYAAHTYAAVLSPPVEMAEKAEQIISIMNKGRISNIPDVDSISIFDDESDTEETTDDELVENTESDEDESSEED